MNANRNGGRAAPGRSGLVLAISPFRLQRSLRLLPQRWLGMGLLGVISILLGGAHLFTTLIGAAELPCFIGVKEANW